MTDNEIIKALECYSRKNRKNKKWHIESIKESEVEYGY